MGTNEKTDLIPGQTIKYFEGEIQSFNIFEWGIEGYVSKNDERYKFRIKNNLEIARQLHCGMSLIITRGYCTKSRKGELIVSDGKFGKIDISLKMNNYYNNNILTGEVVEITLKKNKFKITVKSLIDPNIIWIILPSSSDKVPDEIFYFNNSEYVFFVDESTAIKNIIAEWLRRENKILLRMKLKSDDHENRNKKIIDIEILGKENILYTLESINMTDINKVAAMIPLFIEQLDHIDIEFNRLKTKIVIITGNVSTIELEQLKTIILNKISYGNIKSLNFILYSKEEIINYIRNIELFIDTIIKNRKIQSMILEKGASELIRVIDLFYPDFNSSNLNNRIMR